MKSSKLKSALGGRVAVLILSDGGAGDQALPMKADVSGVRDSSMDGGTGEYAVRMEGVTLPSSGCSKGIGLRAKRSAIGSGCGGNAGTGGGRESLDKPPLREVEAEREPRRKNVFFFLTDTSER